MTHPIRCQCGALQGELHQPLDALRGVCYCKDCRAYARHLGKEAEAVDALGGIDFVATLARHVRLTAGQANLACLSLSTKGLLRWYARCCDTPLANTTRDWKLPYVGLLRSGLAPDPAAYARAFPRIRMRVNTGSALGAPPPLGLKTAVALAGLMPRVLMSRAGGSYRQTPFFAGTGQPVAGVTVLSDAQRQRAYGTPGA